uniref:Carbohydrate sulfotransferase n=1 Tax=Ciona intestinalis TaxID=7719 RepID=F7BJP4_CIOIN
MDSDTKTSQPQEPHITRLKEISSRCESSHYINKRIDLSRFVFDDEHKLIMCVVPKAACTTWKRIMWYLNGCENDKEKYIMTFNFSHIQVLIFSSVSKESAIEKLRSYTKFFVKRSPFERLVSAYRNKFITSKNPNYREKIGKQYAKERLRKYLVTIRHGNLTFEQFTSHIVKATEYNLPGELDVHWRPQVELCNPCALKYDYVIDFRKMATESNELLQYVQRNDDVMDQIRLKETHRVLTNDDTVASHMNLIDDNVKLKLKRLYENDSYILGYSPMRLKNH